MKDQNFAFPEGAPLKLNWTQESKPAVLELKLFLNSDLGIVGMDLHAWPGASEEAAKASYKLGQLFAECRKEAA